MKTLCSPHAFSEYWNQFIARYNIFFISLGTISSFFFMGKKDSEEVVVAGGLTYEPCGD